MVSKDPGVMAGLPCIYLKCTSMIMNTMNFSIDYAAPFIPNLLNSPFNSPVPQRALQLNPPSQQTFSKPGYQVSQPSYNSNNKIIPEKVNKRSNVRMTLQYLGTGFSVTNEVINPKDELSMFQQICGGESICVFKAYLSPGEMFQVISRRHYGYPFSASIYINGLIAARISSCCEYRYHVGFQQGRRGCFRITQLSGGKPCHRCVEFHSQKKYQMKPARDHSTGSVCEGSITSQEKEVTEEMPGDPQIITWNAESVYPALPDPPECQLPLARRRRRVKKKKKTTPMEGSDSEQENKVHDKYPGPRRPQMRDSRKSRTTPSLRGYEDDNEETGERRHVISKDRTADEAIQSCGKTEGDKSEATQRPGETRDHNDRIPAQTHQDSGSLHREEGQQCDVAQRINRKLATALREGTADPDVELSDSSDSSENRSITEVKCRAETSSGEVRSRGAAPEHQGAAESQDQDEAQSHESERAGEDELLSQISDLIAVLHECDEVNQLVLRNTGLTDSLLQRLAQAITDSRSEMESINLNLNDITAAGAETIVHLLREKPSIKSLLLHGNRLGDEGIEILMSGLSELWIPARGTDSASSHNASPFHLSELDIGGNRLTSQGLRRVAAFLQLNPPLKYLGLAHCSAETGHAWREMFTAIKTNTNLTHLLLDQNRLGDAGARLIAELIQVNQSLVAIDLDGNEIGEEGGRVILESLVSGAGGALTDISLDNNSISAGAVETIVTLLTLNTEK